MSLYEQDSPEVFTVKDGEQLTYFEGWSDWLAGELVENTQQEQVQKWIPLPEDETWFVCEERAHHWFENDGGKPLIIGLGNQAMKLAGVAWITNMGVVKKRMGNQFGIRVYDGYREQGVGSYLGRNIHRMFDEERKGTLSYSMHVANQAAFALGIPLGYKMEEGRTSREIDMVRKRPPLL